MKLEKILDQLNSFEKNSFLKIITDIVSNGAKNNTEIDKILSTSSKDLRSIDNANVAKVFQLVESEFEQHAKAEFMKASSQLDILTDIIVRDGNCIMKIDWLSRLYEKELKGLKTKVKDLKASLENGSDDIPEERLRDYHIYITCLEVAYRNDDANNLDRKVTKDELSILIALSSALELSQEEIKLMNYTILPIEKMVIDDVVNELKNAGVIFYQKKHNTIFIADEMVQLMRRIRGKEVADKFLRRVLRILPEPKINLIAKKHGIQWRASLEEKIKDIIKEGVSFSGILKNDIFKPEVTLTERKKTINELCDKGLGISPALKGSTIEEKIDNLIAYFHMVENDEKVGISVDGYEQLLKDLSSSQKKLNTLIKSEFEIQDEDVLSSTLLLDYNIKPRDILEILTEDDLMLFCKNREIKTKGNTIHNILEAYKDSENLYLENYHNIAYRNLAELKDNGLMIKEAEIGLKFEELTKVIFEKLGFNVDESLKKSLNTTKDKMDILINVGNNELIVVECKTSKESGYNKFSAVSKQLRSYMQLVEKNGFRVIKSLLIAPEFSDDFINDCELEYELNLSLITANSLLKILDGFKSSKHKELPYKLLMRDVLIQEDRIIKAIQK